MIQRQLYHQNTECVLSDHAVTAFVQFKFPTLSVTDGAVALSAAVLLLLIAAMEKLRGAKVLKGNFNFSACGITPASAAGGLRDGIYLLEAHLEKPVHI